MKIVWKQKPHYGGAEYSTFYFVLYTFCALLILMAPACWARQVSSNRTLPKKQAPRHSLEFYAKNIRDNLFTPPTPRKPVPTAAPNRKTAPLPIPSPTAPDPFTDWTYSGTVSIGDEKIALLENTKTHEGEYVRQGESFVGQQIEAITDDSIIFAPSGKPNTIAKSDKFNLVPLDKNAPFVDEEKTQAAALLAEARETQSVTGWMLSLVGAASSSEGSASSFLMYSARMHTAYEDWLSTTSKNAILLTLLFPVNHVTDDSAEAPPLGFCRL